MECTAIRSSAYTATVLLGVGLLRCGSIAGAQSSGVDHTPGTSQELPHDPGRSLTASVVALAPGATAASHRHAGIVFASVLEGAVLSQRNGGDVIEYSAGQSWVESPGTVYTRTEHPSQTMLARHLAVFIAPTGAQLTTVDQ